MFGGRRRVIRDPVHEYVELPALLEPILRHPYMQRLRHIGQTSMTSSVYPSATGSRFEHSLGTMHLGRLTTEAIARNSPEAMQLLVDCAGREFPALSAGDRLGVIVDAVGAVGLTHDLGHPPFSHALEEAFGVLAHRENWLAELPHPYKDFASVASAFHEVATVHMLHQLVGDLQARDRSDEPDEQYVAFLDLVLRVATADPDGDDWASTLHGIIAGELDVDRLDYVMRDAQRAGTEFGSLDHVRLVANSELLVADQQNGRFRLGIGVRARSAAETLLVQRAQSYRWIVFHHRVIAGNEALRQAFAAIVELAGSSEKITLPEGGEIPVAQFIGLDWSRLNYLGRGDATAPSELHGHQLPIIADGSTVRAEDSARSHATRVNDGLLSVILHDLMVFSDEQLARPSIDEPEQELRVQLRRVRAYCRAVLLREHRLHPAWKTVDDQRRATVKAVHDPELHALLVAAIEDLRSQFPSGTAGAYLERAGSEVLDKLTVADTSHAALNAIFDEILGEPANRRAFEDILRQCASGALPKSDGEWLVTYARWSSLRSHGRTATVFVGNRPEPLRDGSPLIDAMERADALRLSTMVFYVVTGIESNREMAERDIFKNHARTAVLKALPPLLTNVWVPHLQRKATGLLPKADK